MAHLQFAMLRMMRISASCIMLIVLTSLPLSSRACRCDHHVQPCRGTLECSALPGESTSANACFGCMQEGKILLVPAFIPGAL